MPRFDYKIADSPGPGQYFSDKKRKLLKQETKIYSGKAKPNIKTNPSISKSNKFIEELDGTSC